MALAINEIHGIRGRLTKILDFISIYALTLFYMGSMRYVVTWGGGSLNPPWAKCFLRQTIGIVEAKNGSQCKILVFSYQKVPKKAS